MMAWGANLSFPAISSTACLHYLWQCYISLPAAIEEDIDTGINTFLGVREVHAHPAVGTQAPQKF